MVVAPFAEQNSSPPFPSHIARLVPGRHIAIVVTIRAPGHSHSSRGKSLMVAKRWERALAKVTRLLVPRMSVKTREILRPERETNNAMRTCM